MNGLSLEPGTVPAEARERRALLVFAYATLLFALPVHGFWRAFTSAEPTAWVWIQSGILVLLLLASQVRRPLRPLRGFVLVVLAVNSFTALLVPYISKSALLGDWFSAESPTFWQANSGAMFLKLAATMAIITLLLLMGLKPQDFYLVKGDGEAPAELLRRLGKKTTVPWNKFGRTFAIVSFAAILAVTLLPTLLRLGPGAVAQALPLLPAALLFAAANAIYEEVVFRASYLSQLVNVIGGGHALAITVIYFGLGHLAGSIPSGATGVLLAAFFAFFMGKAMLETGGMTWPWICHFAADAAVFLFLAVLFASGAL